MNRDILGAVAPSQLGAARGHAHWAAQLVAAAGETHAPHVADTSHTAMTYRPDLGAMLGAPALAETLRVALWIAELDVGVVRGDDVLERLSLRGRTLADARSALGEALVRHAGDALAAPLVHPAYDLDPHPLADGATFGADPGELAEVDRWFAHAQQALTSLAQPTDSEILCWPHHFDLAALRTLATDDAGNATRTVGVGLSPGDGAIAEPYWYVNHWPGRDPATTTFGTLPSGRWHTEGFVAAVLAGSEIVLGGTADEQQSLVGEFLASAVRQSEALVR